MEDKSVRITENTHKRLVQYVIDNPLLKLTKIADIGVSRLLDDLEQNNDYSILQQPKKDANAG